MGVEATNNPFIQQAAKEDFLIDKPRTCSDLQHDSKIMDSGSPPAKKAKLDGLELTHDKEFGYYYDEAEFISKCSTDAEFCTKILKRLLSTVQETEVAKRNKPERLWVEEFRPENLDEIRGNNDIMSVLKRNLRHWNDIPNLLLHGPAGTGKTTAAIAIAKEAFGDRNWRAATLELNASDERGIDVVRGAVKDFMEAGAILKHENAALNFSKLIILDEADMMTQVAQFAMRRVMEAHTSDCRFILICNQSNKIIPAIQSRCTCFRYEPVNKEDVIRSMLSVTKAKNAQCKKTGEWRVEYDAEAMAHLAILFNGDLRSVLNTMQSFASIHVYRNMWAPYLPQQMAQLADHVSKTKNGHFNRREDFNSEAFDNSSSFEDDLWMEESLVSNERPHAPSVKRGLDQDKEQILFKGVQNVFEDYSKRIPISIKKEMIYDSLSRPSPDELNKLAIALFNFTAVNEVIETLKSFNKPLEYILEAFGKFVRGVDFRPLSAYRILREALAESLEYLQKGGDETIASVYLIDQVFEARRQQS